jgi:hypothetical protein
MVLASINYFRLTSRAPSEESPPAEPPDEIDDDEKN